jgi:hypothetical protein
MIEDCVPPPWGSKAADVIITENDSTLQTGASVPKTTSDPGVALLVGEGVTLVWPPHPTITTIAKPTRSAGKNARFLLFMPILLKYLCITPIRGRAVFSPPGISGGFLLANNYFLIK